MQSTPRRSTPSARPSPGAAHIQMRSSFETQQPSPTLLACDSCAQFTTVLIADPVVRCFLRDHDVMRMAFAEPGGGDLDALRVVFQHVDIRGPNVAHCRSETAH